MHSIYKKIKVNISKVLRSFKDIAKVLVSKSNKDEDFKVF